MSLLRRSWSRIVAVTGFATVTTIAFVVLRCVAAKYYHMILFQLIIPYISQEMAELDEKHKVYNSTSCGPAGGLTAGRESVSDID